MGNSFFGKRNHFSFEKGGEFDIARGRGEMI